MVLTLANAAKPLVIDDTAYTYFARQIAAEPTDPYGFELLWYHGAQPAFDVLAPPVFPYWLAGSMVLFGDEPLRWKLALFPFALALAAALRSLLSRFAPGLAAPLLWMAILSPPVLPFQNLMLDLPSLALGLLSLALFLRSCDRGSAAGAAAAGLLAGIAMQTKYTAATTLAAILVYGALFGRLRLALLSAVVGACVFLGWEGLPALAYGRPHFLEATAMFGSKDPGFSPVKAAFWAIGFIALVGGVAAPFGLLALSALEVPARIVACAALAVALCFASVPFLPGVTTPVDQMWPLLEGAPTEQSLFFALGLGTIGSVAAVARRRLRDRPEREDYFLLAWLGIELACFAALSPFLAARRVFQTSLAALFLCARALARGRAPGEKRGAVRIAIGAGVALGLLYAAGAFADALAIRDSVRSVEGELRALGADPRRETVWFTGHWGFQFYAERAGMHAVSPGVSQLRRGDWLVAPEGVSVQPFR